MWSVVGGRNRKSDVLGLPPDFIWTMTEYVGYNDWASDELGVVFATDFVYDMGAQNERGVFIAEDIAPHTRVFSIPRKSLFTSASVLTHTALSSLSFFQQDSKWSEDDRLAIALLYERHVLQTSSKWAPHISLLPQAYDNVLYFTTKELELLKGSNVYPVATQLQEKLTTDFAQLQDEVLPSLFEAIPHDQRPSQDIFDEWFSLESYRWALSTVWSRFVSISMDGDTSAKAMVPVFDMLNHAPEVEMAHFYDAKTDEFVLESHQHWSAGSQVYIPYGALSNHKLLTLYGFVLPENAYDAIELWLPMDPNTSFFLEKESKLQELGIDHESTPLEIVSDELNDLLLISLRIQYIEADNLDVFRDECDKVMKGEALDDEREKQVLAQLVLALEDMLSRFPPTSEDEELVEDLSKRERMAIMLRQSDRRIVQDNIRMLKWKLLALLPEEK